MQKLAGSQQCPPLLARERLHMHRAVQVDPHHLRDAACVITIRLVWLRLQERFHMARQDDRVPSRSRTIAIAARRRS